MSLTDTELSRLRTATEAVLRFPFDPDIVQAWEELADPDTVLLLVKQAQQHKPKPAPWEGWCSLARPDRPLVCQPSQCTGCKQQQAHRERVA